MMIPVLDAPVAPDGFRKPRRIQADLTGVVGHLLASFPQAGARVLQPSQPGAAGPAADQRLPVRAGPVVNLEDLATAVLLAAMVTAVHRLISADWLLLIAERGHRVVQG